MNTFDFKKYIAEGGIEEKLLLAELNGHFDSFIQEFSQIESLNESDSLTEEEKQQLNEIEPISLTIGLILSAPKIIELLGKLIKGAVSIFKKVKNKLGFGDSEDVSGENKATAWLEKNAHKLHDKYIGIIKKSVKLLGFASKVWKDPKTGKVDDDKLKLVAEVLLLVSIGIAAGYSFTGGIGALKAGHPIVAALEGGLASIKSSEIANILSKVGPKIAQAAGL